MLLHRYANPTIDKRIHVCPIGIVALETTAHLPIEECAVLLVLYALREGINLGHIEYAHYITNKSRVLFHAA